MVIAWENLAGREREIWEEGFAVGYERCKEHMYASESVRVARGAEHLRFSGIAPRSRPTPPRHPYDSRPTSLTPSKRKARKPSKYNLFMRRELKRLRKKHPRTKQTVLFKKAAKAWKYHKRDLANAKRRKKK